MCFSDLETLILTFEFGNNWVLCQINWVSIPKFLKIIEYLLKTYGYFTRILPLSLALCPAEPRYALLFANSVDPDQLAPQETN